MEENYINDADFFLDLNNPDVSEYTHVYICLTIDMHGLSEKLCGSSSVK